MTVTIVGGSGAVGAMLAQQHRAHGHTVVVIDREANSSPADITDLDESLRSVLQRSDTVILAVPADVARDTLPGVTESMADDALLIDTLSVKAEFAGHLRAIAPARAALGINPMFAPSLGIDGRVIAATVHHGAPSVRTYIDLLGGWGAHVAEVDAVEHDRTVSVTQALTHAAILSFGIAMTELKVDPVLAAALAPPPFTTMAALLARVSSGTPEVYHDVQQGNPNAADARAALARAIAVVDDAAATEPDFAAMMERAYGSLGADGPEHRARCADIFAGLLSLKTQASKTQASKTQASTTQASKGK